MIQHSRAARPTATLGDLTAAMDLLALALQGGIGIAQALEVTAEQLDEPLAGHLRTVSAAMAWGVSDARAWATVPAAWQATGQALALASVAGVPPSALIARAADDLRREEQARLDLAGARLEVALSLPVGLVFLPAFFLTTVVPVIAALATQTLGGVLPTQ